LSFLVSFYFPEALQQSFLKNHASIFTPRHKKYFHQQKTPNSGQALTTKSSKSSSKAGKS